MEKEPSESPLWAAVAFLGGIGLVAAVGSVLLASTASDSSAERKRSPQPENHAMPASSSSSSESCGCAN